MIIARIASGKKIMTVRQTLICALYRMAYRARIATSPKHKSPVRSTIPGETALQRKDIKYPSVTVNSSSRMIFIGCRREDSL